MCCIKVLASSQDLQSRVLCRNSISSLRGVKTCLSVSGPSTVWDLAHSMLKVTIAPPDYSSCSLRMLQSSIVLYLDCTSWSHVDACLGPEPPHAPFTPSWPSPDSAQKLSLPRSLALVSRCKVGIESSCRLQMSITLLLIARSRAAAGRMERCSFTSEGAARILTSYISI